MSKSRFEPVTSELAPAGSRALLQASQQNFGFIPSPVAKAARSPVLLKQLLSGLTAFDHSSLSARECEVVAMTVAFENECDYCMALHSARLASAPENAQLLAELRAGDTISEPRLEVLRSFVLELLRERGRVSELAWSRFVEAGFSQEQALDVLQGVGAYWLSTVGNVFMGAELDPAFVPFAWSKPKKP